MKRFISVAVIIGLLLTATVLSLTMPTSGLAQEKDNPYLVETFIDEDGMQIDVIIAPGKPPEIESTIADVPEPSTAGGGW